MRKKLLGPILFGFGLMLSLGTFTAFAADGETINVYSTYDDRKLVYSLTATQTNVGEDAAPEYRCEAKVTGFLNGTAEKDKASISIANGIEYADPTNSFDSGISHVYTVVEVAANAFNGCQGLSSVSIPNTVTTIGQAAFEGCTNLSEISFSAVATIGQAAFKGCTNLSKISLSTSIKSIGVSAFEGCTNLNSITIPQTVEATGSSSFKGCSSLETVTINDGVKTISDSTFLDCSALKNLSIAGSVTAIGKNAFSGCSSLESVSIPNSVTTIGDYAFYNCTTLTEVTFVSTETISEPQVTTIGSYAFAGCSVLNAFNKQDNTWLCILPDSVTSLGSYAFSGCKSITIFGTSSAENIGSYAFENCEELVQVTFGNNLKSINAYTFKGCVALKHVNAPNNCTIKSHAFTGCGSCENGHTGFSMNVLCTLEPSAFESCPGITGLYMYIKDRNLTIPEKAFCDCPNLISVYGCSYSLGDFAFQNCPKLTSFNLQVEAQSVSETAFYQSPLVTFTVSTSDEGKFYVSDGCLFTKSGNVLLYMGDKSLPILPPTTTLSTNAPYTVNFSKNPDSILCPKDIDTNFLDGKTNAIIKYETIEVDGEDTEDTRTAINLISVKLAEGITKVKFPCKILKSYKISFPADYWSDYGLEISHPDLVYSSSPAANDETHTLRCPSCGYTTTQEHTLRYSSLGHSMGHSATCTVCGKSWTREHEFGEYKFNNDASCCNLGTETATCKYCSETDQRYKTEGFYAKHDFEWDKEDHVFVCDNCNTRLSATLNKTFIKTTNGLRWYYPNPKDYAEENAADDSEDNTEENAADDSEDNTEGTADENTETFTFETAEGGGFKTDFLLEADENTDLSKFKVTCNGKELFPIDVTGKQEGTITKPVFVEGDDGVDGCWVAYYRTYECEDATILIEDRVDEPQGSATTTKKVILTRTTYYLSYTDAENDLSAFEKTTTPKNAKKPNPTDPEIYTATDFDGNTFNFTLTLYKNNDIRDFRVTANNKIVEGTDNGNMTYTYSVNLEDQPLTLINVACPYDADNSGKYENTDDGPYIYFHKWRP